MSTDLTQSYPRSVRAKLAGIVQLARTTDKARAYVAGTLGEYDYTCPMDQALFRFLGTDHIEFAEKAAELRDAEFERWIREQFLFGKSAREIDRWNEAWIQFGPQPGSDIEKYFAALRNQVAPGRMDVTTWADFLDLEEGRDVPLREAA